MSGSLGHGIISGFNAFDAMAQRSTGDVVQVSTEVDGDWVEIQVADSGAGMDPETFQRAMQRGYSTKSGSDAAHQGLGLALVAQIVTRHGGTLSADITYGSVVSVNIP